MLTFKEYILETNHDDMMDAILRRLGSSLDAEKAKAESKKHTGIWGRIKNAVKGGHFAQGGKVKTPIPSGGPALDKLHSIIHGPNGSRIAGEVSDEDQMKRYQASEDAYKAKVDRARKDANNKRRRELRAKKKAAAK